MAVRASARAWLSRALAVGLLAGLAACSGNDADSRSSPVDPQVLQDVISATFMVPGADVRRAMRVLQFGREQAIEKCGGEAGPIDGTANRYDQSRFPDLALIRSRGFSEPEATAAEDRRLEAIGGDCRDLAPPFPAYRRWFVLQSPWADVVTAAEQDERLTRLKAPMATCLDDATGLDVAADDPVNSFLRAVNTELAHGSAGREKSLARAYADCAAPYFDELRTLLLARRPALVERHRELITTYAREISGAGYVP